MLNQVIGNKGEDVVSDYLKKNGYQIIARNLHFGHKELDIVARLGSMLVFVEVKSRTTRSYGDGSEELEGDKARKFSRAAQLYLEFNDWKDDFRLDLVTVHFQGEKFEIEHIKDIV